jgi:hypothetical protein
MDLQQLLLIKGGDVMKFLLGVLLATVIVAPCMAADSEDRTSSDVLTPGVNEPRVPDTLKSSPDERIRTEGRASEKAGEKDRGLNEKRDGEKADTDRK